jgi:hypothetical protein
VNYFSLAYLILVPLTGIASIASIPLLSWFMPSRATFIPWIGFTVVVFLSLATGTIFEINNAMKDLDNNRYHSTAYRNTDPKVGNVYLWHTDKNGNHYFDNTIYCQDGSLLTSTTDSRGSSVVIETPDSSKCKA